MEIGYARDFNVSQVCITPDQFIVFMQNYISFDDAVKVAVGCFVAGILFVYLLEWIDKKWKVQR
jgi:hypothetical protein